jgi:hypothetical protein
MSGGKGRGKQSRDTASEDALVARPGATDRLLAAREGATDAQIAFALRQGLPHLTDLASLEDSRDGKQPEGTGTTEKGKQPAAQMKRTRTTRQATQTQPLLLAADAFVAALGAVPAEDWCRTWAAGRTIVLRRTSKRVKEAVDKMRLPAVVRLSRRFWDDARHGTEKEKRQFVLRQLTAMSARCSITTLELRHCAIAGPHAEDQGCGSIANQRSRRQATLQEFGFGSVKKALPSFEEHTKVMDAFQGTSAEWLAGGVLAQCPGLVHLDLCGNEFGPAGAKSLARVLGQCTALAHLNLSWNEFGAAGAKFLAQVLAQCPALAHLDLSHNAIRAAGAESLAGVLGQCTALAHLNLGHNQIGPAGAESLAGVLGQCTALDHLNLSTNDIGEAGAESLSEVLGQCTALTLLNLQDNYIDAVWEEWFRTWWHGPAWHLHL